MIRFSGVGQRSQLSNKNEPVISVVMAVYNEAKYVKEAIDSILSQSFKNFEFIIVDDGSTDDTNKIIQSYQDSRIKLLSLDHGGLPRALNIGIDNSRSNIIARMDGDDIAIHFRLEKQIQYLDQNINCLAVGSAVEVIDKDSASLYRQEVPISFKEIKKHMPIIPMYHSSICFRKDIFYKCGGYDTNLLTAQDRLLFNKMATFGALNNINEVLLKYRIHPGAISRRTNRDYKLLNQAMVRLINNKDADQNDYDNINIVYSKHNNSEKRKKGLYYLKIGKLYIEKIFDRNKAFKNLIRSILYYPINVNAWYNLFLILLPKSMINKLKKFRGAQI